MINITIGAIIPPRNSPNLNQRIFKKVNIFGLKNASKKKIIEINKVRRFKLPALIKGYRAIIRNTKANKMPKDLSEPLSSFEKFSELSIRHHKILLLL